MNIHFIESQKFIASEFDEEGFVVSGEKPVYELTALATFVLSLARCTFSVLWVYGDRKEINPDSIKMTMSWDFDHEPTRFRKIMMHIDWQDLPKKKQKAVQKMAEHCTIHSTIHECVEVVTELKGAA